MECKLNTLSKTYATKKKVAVAGEELALKTLGILHSIDDVLQQFANVMKDPEFADELANVAGGSQLEYSNAVASILFEAKTKIEALG